MTQCKHERASYKTFLFCCDCGKTAREIELEEKLERAGRLRDALKYIYDATTKDKGLTMHETTRIYVIARDTLEAYEEGIEK
jgi:hypothetical protein